MADYQENKWPYVHTQYGVFDPKQGKVIPLPSRERAQDLAHDSKWGFGPAMVRHISDWLPDE